MDSVPLPEDDGHRISILENEIAGLRQDRRQTQSRIDSARMYAKQSGNFENEVLEQQDRLSSIKALPKNPETGEWQWPFCEANLALESPIAKALLSELTTLDAEMSIVAGQRPKMDVYLTELEDEVQTIVSSIRAKEVELAAAIAANEVIEQLGTRNNAAARVIGRISLFLEDLVPNSELATYEAENRRLKLKVEDLQRKFGADSSHERLISILNNISSQITRYIQAFDAEFQGLLHGLI